MITYTEFIELVAKMREAQRTAREEHTQSASAAAIRLENKVDRLVREMRAPAGVQSQMFGARR